jgi:hypothetical protein
VLSHAPMPSSPRRRSRRSAALVPVAALLAVSPVLHPAAAGAQEVSNGTFETGVSGWVATPSADGTAPVPLARVAGGHSGSYAAQVSNTSAVSTTTVLNDSPNTVVNTTAGRTYHAVAWLRATRANTSLGLRMLEFSSAGSLQTSAQGSYWATDTAWHQVTVDLTTKTAGGSVDVNALAWGLPAGQSFLVDDVSVVPVATTTTPPAPTTTGVLPAQGTGALYGYYPPGGGDPRPMESTIGRKFDIIHHFAGFNADNGIWPNSSMLNEASQGRIIHVGWELTDYSGGYDSTLEPAPAASTTDRLGNIRKTWTYSQVNNGSLDRYLDAVAAKVKANSTAKFIVDIDPEMDDRPDVGGNAKLRAIAGSRTEYAAAFRHIVNRFRAKSVTNVVWSWTVSGWYAGDPSKRWSLEQLWPGAGYVNMVQWDPYNHSTTDWRSFSQIVSPFYNAFRGGVLDNVDSTAKKLPLGLGEYGCIADSRRPAWLKAVPSQARSFPALIAIDYFNSGSWGAFGTDSASISAFGVEGQDAWFHTRG